MSFNVDLWNGFDIIKNEFSTYQKRLKKLIDILTSYSLIQKEYFKGLDNLYNEIKEAKDVQKSNSLLDESIILLIKSFKVEIHKNKILYNNLTKNLNEIKEKLEKIKAQISPYFLENIQNKESFNRVLNNLILKQKAFNKSFKEYSYHLAENEAQKIIKEKSRNKTKKNNDKNLNNNSKDPKDRYKELVTKNFGYYLTYNVLRDMPDKEDSFTKKILENKKEYIKCISESDKEREKYNTLTEDLLNHLQKQFKLLIFLFQTVINNYIKDKISIYNDIIEVNKLNDKDNYSKINYKTETLDFIMKNATKEFPMNKLEFIPYKANKNKIILKIAKLGEFSAEEQDKIYNQVKDFINKNNLNKYENEYLRQSLINRAFTDILQKMENVNKFRRSGSSDMLNLKNNGNNNILTKFSNSNKNINRNIVFNKNNNNFLSKNKDDIALSIEKKTKSSFNYIKEFVMTLIISKKESKKNILFDIYSDNSSDENEDNKDEVKKRIRKETHAYNELLFGFMNLISISNNDHNENLEYFISILGFHRSKGYFELNENAYKIFINIFNYILVNFKTYNNIIKNIIIFSQTFYKLDENNPNNKIYLLSGLKNHSAFNNIETWHRVINYNLSLSLKNNNYSLNIANKEEYMKNLNKIILTNIISYLYDLKLSTNDKNVYEQVKNFYIIIYKLDKKYIEENIDKLVIDSENEKIEDKNEEKVEERVEEKVEEKNENNNSSICDN